MMPYFYFHSRLFDLNAEPPNPINPVPGVSFLNWLHVRVPEMTVPKPEDWGWCSFLEMEGRRYLIGSSAIRRDDGDHEWVIQIEKHRTLKEKLLGQAKMSEKDPCLVRIYELIQNEPEFTSVALENGPR